MDKRTIIKNPAAVKRTTVRCMRCDNVYEIMQINCIDTSEWPEAKEKVLDGEFFKCICPSCDNYMEVAYPCRYISEEDKLSIALVPEIENRNIEETLQKINKCTDNIILKGVKHRIVGNFYSLAEQIRINENGLDDRVIQILKPLIIGQLQSQGMEVWNGFFIGIEHPETNEREKNVVYMSTKENSETVYTEDIFWYDIYLTNGQVISNGINKTAFNICKGLIEKYCGEDDGKFHLYDLSWAIDFHNSMS